MIKLYTKVAKLLFVLPAVIFSYAAQAQSQTFTVNSLTDAGGLSLGEAITAANTNGNPADVDVIEFNIPGAGPHTYALTAALPTITQAVLIDGYTQPGSLAGTIAARTIVINLDGAAIASGPDGRNVFTVQTSNVTIRGLAIYNAPEYGIEILNGSNNITVQGNYFGTDNTGTTTGLGNTLQSIASNFLDFSGIANLNIVVGVDGNGTNDANEGNLFCSSEGDGGGVTGNNGDAIVFWRTQQSTIAGNVIGFNKNGTGTGFGNVRHGIQLTIDASQNVVGTDGDGVSDALEANYIGNSGGFGLHIAANSQSNIVAGNVIGLDANEVAAGNGLSAPLFHGIQIINSSNNRIGTDGLGASNAIEGNIICASGKDGINITAENFFGFNGNANGNIVAGNSIGTNAAGSVVAGNAGAGVSLVQLEPTFTTSNNIIGSNFDGNGDALEGNRISNNGAGGIVSNTPQNVAGGVLNNRFSTNSISNNTGLGIDLGATGVASNDDGDTDDGPNALFNAPVITAVEIDGSNNLTIRGFTRPGSVVEFYIADAGPNPDPLGSFTKSFGEGATYLFRAQEGATLNGIADADAGTGTYDGTTEGTQLGGNRTENLFSFTIPVASLLPNVVNAGTRVTALAYSTAVGAGNTSEFGGVFTTIVTPVVLESFTGRLQNGKVYLNWRTSLEINNSHFEVEKSTDGSTYKSIGSVPGKGGINNDYSFIDDNPSEKINYYRLRQVDIGGRPTNSKIVIIRGDLGALTAKASPNPFNTFVNISYKLDRPETLQVRIVNTSGYVVKTTAIRGSAGVNNTNIPDLGFLPAGNYVIELIGNNLTYRQQLIKK